MTTLEISGGRALRGRVRVPGDKSISHRALILGARAEGTSTVRGMSSGQDVARTAAAVRYLGADVRGERVSGGTGRLFESDVTIDVGNSGTAIRLMSGFCAAFPWLTVLVGDDSVSRRPMDRVAEPLRSMGAGIHGRGQACLAPLTIRGGHLHGIDHRPSVASAQVKGAVLLAGLGAEGETVVRERTRTRAHTEEMLAACGADVEVSPDGLTVRLRPSRLRPFELDVPGDPSQAAFWVVAACITPGSEVVVERVYVGPARAAFLDVLRRMGAHVELEPLDATTAHVHARFGPLQSTEVGGDEVPGLIDEIPVLAVAAGVAEGVSTFAGVGELRLKETDRIATFVSELTAVGARVEPLDDGLVVSGQGRLLGGGGVHHPRQRRGLGAGVRGAEKGRLHGRPPPYGR